MWTSGLHSQAAPAQRTRGHALPQSFRSNQPLTITRSGAKSNEDGRTRKASKDTRSRDPLSQSDRKSSSSRSVPRHETASGLFEPRRPVSSVKDNSSPSQTDAQTVLASGAAITSSQPAPTQTLVERRPSQPRTASATSIQTLKNPTLVTQRALHNTHLPVQPSSLSQSLTPAKLTTPNQNVNQQTYSPPIMTYQVVVQACNTASSWVCSC